MTRRARDEQFRIRAARDEGGSLQRVLVQSFFAAWFGPERLAGHRPTELAAFDSEGREIATFPLDPEVFRPCRGELSDCDAESRL